MSTYVAEMSRHEGVSCDACLKANFRGRRFKCLTCFDYDLCSGCYESAATSNLHASDHPMQCILTRADFDLFHGGENLSSTQPQSLTCPICGKMGNSESSLRDHVTSNHPDTSASEVVCPICASMFGGDPNHITADFAGHLAIDHQSGAPRDLDVTENGTRHNVRRMPQQARGFGRGVTRQNMRFGDSMDPIAELLSQLSGVRRTTASELTSPLHYDQAVLRQHVRRGAPSRIHSQAAIPTSSSSSTNASSMFGVASSVGSTAKANAMVNAMAAASDMPNMVPSQNSHTTPNHTSKNQDQLPQFLLARLSVLEKEYEHKHRHEVKDRSDFVQELLLSTLSISQQGCRQVSQIAAQEPPIAETSDASTQTTNSTNSSSGNPVPVSAPPFTKSQQSVKPPSTKSQKYSYLNSNANQQQSVVRGLAATISSPYKSPPSGQVSPNLSKKKPSKNPDVRTPHQQPPH